MIVSRRHSIAFQILLACLIVPLLPLSLPGAPALAGEADPSSSAPTTQRVRIPDSRPDEDGYLYHRLDRRLPELRFDAVRLEEALDFLTEQFGMKLAIHWQAISTVGITRDTPITLRLRDVRSSRVLLTLLDAAAGDKPVLGCVILDGVITISTCQDLSSHTVVRIYAVRDLLAGEVPSAERLDELTQSIAAAIPGALSMSIGLADDGPIGSISVHAGELFIRHTPDTHAHILRHLASLRPAAQNR